jgi:hypothetical protein
MCLQQCSGFVDPFPFQPPNAAYLEEASIYPDLSLIQQNTFGRNMKALLDQQ